MEQLESIITPLKVGDRCLMRSGRLVVIYNLDGPELADFTTQEEYRFNCYNMRPWIGRYMRAAESSRDLVEVLNRGRQRELAL